MKKHLHLTFLVLLISLAAASQITTPVVRAFFGVDADLKARSVNGVLQSSDDWYLLPGAAGTSSNGIFVIDTTGAAAIVAGYATDVSPFPRRMQSFYRTMSRPAFTVVNNRLWLDALFIRDYHANDSTAFVSGSDKNGMSPANWTGGIQGIPDKNDILDMFMHIRRAGPNTTDSLWMFGALSLDNVTGNRYFDFEMYQTDIYYDRVSGKWYGYGPDAGHTSWQFDAAGNVTRPGDIIFTAEYQSSSLTSIEARIWVDRSALSITPAQFNWSGKFDGASSGAQFGYASIMPKTAGTFYTGLQSGNGEWAGPFSLVLQDNSLATNYTARQFMEFSVNLSKLGLDPVGMLAGDICGTPFNRLVVKTRASASFTAELKDFVAPIDLFLAPRVNALADVPLFCGRAENVSTLTVTNPAPSSVYTWSTPDGNIIGDPSSTSIEVDREGMYIVRQQLMSGCSTYAQDTVYITRDPDCTVLESGSIDFKAYLKETSSVLTWTTTLNNYVKYYEVEKSLDGKSFRAIGRIENTAPGSTIKAYTFTDAEAFNGYQAYYRLKVVTDRGIVYSKLAVIRSKQKSIIVFPNPATAEARLIIPSDGKGEATVAVYTATGGRVYLKNHLLNDGDNSILLHGINTWGPGVYLVHVSSSLINQWHKLMIKR